MNFDRVSGKKLLVGGLALFATFALAGQVAAQSKQLAGKEIRIGAIVPSSGPFAEWGRSNTTTLKLLEHQINAAGGVEGAKLHIFIYDDGGKPSQAANLVRRLAEDDKVLAIAGPLTSSAVEVAFPVANEMKVVATSQASSKPGVAALNRPWGFRNTVDELVLGRATVPYFKNTYKVSSVAIIYDAKDANAVALGSHIMPGLLKENGIKILNDGKALTFNTGDIDVSAQVTTIRSLNPDGIVVAADSTQAVTVIRELKRQGLLKPVLGGTPLIAAATLKAAPEIPIIAPATFYYSGKGGTSKMDKFAAALQPALRKTSGLPISTRSSRCILMRYTSPVSHSSLMNWHRTVKRSESLSRPAHLMALLARSRSKKMVMRPSRSSLLSARMASGPKAHAAAARREPLQVKAASRCWSRYSNC
jgi:branched-chain amino acid transport system substrate-binding protein